MFWSSASRPSCESGLLNSIFYGSDPNRKSFHRILRALALVVIVGWGMPVNWMRETGEEAFCPLPVCPSPMEIPTTVQCLRIHPGYGLSPGIATTATTWGGECR